MGIFYIKECLGQNSKPIYVVKIRTMRNGADRELGSLLESGLVLDSQGKIMRDPRIISGFHGFLRKHWLDELPQLYNIVSGELKLVGIRPRNREDWGKYPKELMERALLQKPGLCGISYAFERTDRFEDATDQMARYLDDYERNPVECDKEYLRRIVRNVRHGTRSS